MKEFSKKFEADGMIFEEPTDMMFSFNNPLGACPTCEGFGKVLGIDRIWWCLIKVCLSTKEPWFAGKVR